MKPRKAEFVEDIVNQSNIDFEKAINAKFKHPFKHWASLRWFIFKDSISMSISKTKGLFFRARKKISFNK